MALDDGGEQFLWLTRKVDKSTLKSIFTLQSIYHLHTTKYISRALMNLNLKRCHVRPVAVVGKEEERRRCARARPLFLPFFLPSSHNIGMCLSISIPFPSRSPLPLPACLPRSLEKLPLNASSPSASAFKMIDLSLESNKCYHWFSTCVCLKYECKHEGRKCRS